MGTHSLLETLSDSDGSVTVGWVGDGVLYSRYEGGLSATIGAAHAARLEALVTEAPAIRYFSDARAMTHYDLLARSSFVRVVLAKRRRFASMIMLTWREGVGPAAQALTSILGGSIYVLTDVAEFERRLFEVAPFASSRLEELTRARMSAGRESEKVPDSRPPGSSSR